MQYKDYPKMFDMNEFRKWACDFDADGVPVARPYVIEDDTRPSCRDSVIFALDLHFICDDFAFELHFSENIRTMNVHDLQKLSLCRESLADCIRDGIELNYGSWQEWQSIAREIMKTNAPDHYRRLNPEARCLAFCDMKHTDVPTRKDEEGGPYDDDPMQ